ncbi:hypothetical protein FSARC_631 [Fusarium sarcochroum]|uniref:Adenosine deaminase domain-containing protein n=1 Tax=Fusarium sarcochroum TaxID=1208366 RepID=A0A8H4UAR6_9HYPO|nr:hypothetical protein FSARC_631 [Fusarium sarcochroum]
MVTLTEVEDEHFQHTQAGPDVEEEDDDYSDTDSEISNESEYDPSDETFAERLYALRDIVPPTTRSWISGKASTVGNAAWSVLSFSGKGAWVITTSALFFGVPFALSFAEDQQLTAMEQEYNMRQSGGELLTAGSEQSTADQVGAALDGQQAKPALCGTAALGCTKFRLHAHLTGSISRRALHEIWRRKKATGNTDLEDPLVVMPEGKHDYNLQTFFPLFSSYIYNLITDEESVRYTTNSVLTDFLNDGVCYLELRTTPRSTSQLSAEQYIATLLDTISSFEAENTELHTRLILSVDRRHTPEQAASALSLALKYRNEGVVGLDLCGDPTARPGGEISVFTPVFQEAKEEGLEVTVHFAEAEASGSKEELETLLSWEPGRLGHVIWEDEEIKKEIARRGLCLELCLSCNVRAGMVLGGFEGHHFGHWRGVEGPKISLSTDDVGVFGSPLSNEYRLVAQHFSLGPEAICRLARQPIDGIFGGEEEKERLRRIMWTS